MNLLAVVLISYVVHAVDDCAAARGPVRCYECSTENNELYCHDPFNLTVTTPRIVTCKEACAKWVRKPKHGPTHIIRTCASELNVKMQWSTVCMKESRPGDGHLCFCDEDLCNSATTSGRHCRVSWPLLLCLALLALLLPRAQPTGIARPVTWCAEYVTCWTTHVTWWLRFVFGESLALVGACAYWTNASRLRKNDTKDTNIG